MMRVWWACGLLLVSMLACDVRREGGEPVRTAGPVRAAAKGAGDGRFALHPYLGYTYAPGADGINRHGFDAGGREYPYVRGADEFVVGIFGGSTALQVARNAHEIEQALLPLAARRGYTRVTVLPFAVDGWRQPQPFHAFLAYLPTIDMAVLIDGLAEVLEFGDASVPGWPADFPSARIYGALSGLERGPDVRSRSERVDAYFEAWEERIRMMDLIGLESGKPVLHFVEPNPYARPEHESDPRADVAAPGYERLRDMAERLARDGVASSLLDGAFDGADEALYDGECCALNEEGAARLGWAVAQEGELGGQFDEAVPAADRKLPPPPAERSGGLPIPVLGSTQ